MSSYSTAPKASKHLPRGIPYIIGNELAERFSFYGMKCILVIFMTKHLMDTSGNLSSMDNTEATFWYHLFHTRMITKQSYSSPKSTRGKFSKTKTQNGFGCVFE